jgi:breast cancer 2 susceptibility protein
VVRISHGLSPVLTIRYEREIGSAQRPIVRRIHEHDSPPSVPMVLCVSAILHSKEAQDEEGKAVMTRAYLELTDGWYRIMAEVDESLGRAITKGKITVGRKLAISGAKVGLPVWCEVPRSLTRIARLGRGRCRSPGSSR